MPKPILPPIPVTLTLEEARRIHALPRPYDYLHPTRPEAPFVEGRKIPNHRGPRMGGWPRGH